MKLIPNTKAPHLTLLRMGGGQWSLANQRLENFLLLVLYRGHHCPICKNYLEKLNSLLGDASKHGITVFAASGDTEEQARKSQNEWKIDDLDLGYGMTVAQMNKWGLYPSDATRQEEPALFLISRDLRIYYAAYNSMPVGSLIFKEVIAFVEFILKGDYPSERREDRRQLIRGNC